jgi:hypothetical protein
MKALWFALLLLLPCSALAQALVDGIQPSAINGIPVTTGFKFNGITLTPPGGSGTTHTFAYALSNDQGNTCSGASCTMTISSTIANSVVALAIYTPSNVTVSSVSGCSATWSIGASSSYSAFNSAVSGTNLTFAPSVAAACTSVAVTLSAAPSGNWDIIEDEFTVTGTGPAVVDQLASSNLNSTGCTSCTLSGFTGLTGTNDLLLQAINYGGSGSTVGSPYTFDTNSAFAYLANSTSGTAPILTQSTSSGAVSLGVALK